MDVGMLSTLGWIVPIDLDSDGLFSLWLISESLSLLLRLESRQWILKGGSLLSWQNVATSFSIQKKRKMTNGQILFKKWRPGLETPLKITKHGVMA
eukprot:scaffold6818_cov95-Cylindrotheca_fusiformis.AAC.7